MVVGVISHVKFDPHRLTVPVWPDQIHWWLGRLLWVAALVNLFLGVWEIAKPFGYRTYRNPTLPPYVLLGAWLLLVRTNFKTLVFFLKKTYLWRFSLSLSLSL